MNSVGLKIDVRQLRRMLNDESVGPDECIYVQFLGGMHDGDVYPMQTPNEIEHVLHLVRNSSTKRAYFVGPA